MTSIEHIRRCGAYGHLETQIIEKCAPATLAAAIQRTETGFAVKACILDHTEVLTKGKMIVEPICYPAVGLAKL